MDWQYCLTLPTFVDTGIPTALDNSSDEEASVESQPLEDLNSLNADEHAEAQDLFRRRHTHWHYLNFTMMLNEHHRYVCGARASTVETPYLRSCWYPVGRLRGYLHIASDGWTPNENFDAAKECAELIKKQALEA